MNLSRTARARSLSAVLLAALGCASGCRSHGKTHDVGAQRGSVVGLVAPSSGLGLQICDAEGAACSRATLGTAVPAGSLLRSGSHSSAQIRLGDGTALALDHDTELHLASSSRGARLSRGALVLDVPSKTGARLRLDVNEGQVELAAGKLALRAGSDFAILDVIRGSAMLSSGRETPLRVNAGEEARLYRGAAPYVSSGGALAEAVAFTDRLLEANEAESSNRGLGELIAHKPGSSDELRSVVKLAVHSVRVRIAGAMARTEIDEVFENSSDEVLEGIYRFPIPADAKIERLALEVDGKLEEGAFVDRDRAAAIWRGAIVHAAPNSRPQVTEDIVWVPGPWRDPALLEWQRGGRFELKIFPIPKRGQRRIVLAYTEAVRAIGGVRHFTYPLPVDPGGTTKIRHLDLNIEVRGHDPQFGVRTLGYPLIESKRDGAHSLTLQANDFTPNGDLGIEWALPERNSELSAFGYRTGDGDRFALLTLRPRLPRSSADRVHATVLVVDSSRSMFGQGLERAKHLATRLGRELDPAGPVTLLACDSTCRELPAGFITPGPAAALEMERFLANIPGDGASDPTQAIASAKRALDAVSGRPLKDIVYIGDGTPTVGPIRVATVSSAVRDTLADSEARVTAVAIGSSADLDTLGALARAGGGLVLPYAPGQTLGEACLAVLAASYGSALRDVELVLPSGLREIAPERLDTLVAGGEALISARMDAERVDGPLIVRGKVGETPFEQRYELHLTASDGAGNAFVPRVYAAARIADLEQKGSAEAKKEALALSTRFAVASRYSSLLVLESEAMFRAFGLSAAERTNRFTGDEVAAQSDAQGELSVADADDALELATRMGSSGRGPVDKKSDSGFLGGGLAAAPAPAAASEAAKAKAPSPPRSAPRLDRAEADFAEPPPAPTAAKPRARPPDLPRRRMIAMRRVWDRKGYIDSNERVPRNASITAIADAERALSTAPDRRSSVKKLYSLYAVSSDLGRASSLVERWLSKEPLDPEALTARADLAARRGDRELAIRLLGSVVDVRPDDVAGQKRMARLYRWSGRADLGCRHAMAIAELRSSDAKLLADALRCARGGSAARWASDALALADDRTARLATSLADKPAADDMRLLGDLRIEATWQGDADLDLAILHPDGQRVSWLGAPTREVIAARDVLSLQREGLALNAAKPGQYAIEVVRSEPSSKIVRGELTLLVAGETRRIPFQLDGQRVTVALAEIKMVPRLVPLESPLSVLAEDGIR